MGCTGKAAVPTGDTGTGIDFNEFLSSFANYLALISGGRGFKLFTFFSNAEKSPKGFA